LYEDNVIVLFVPSFISLP